jgi:small subunit ribosomal protein S6
MLEKSGEEIMDRTYEVMFIVRPDVADEDLDKLIEGFTTTVTTGGGEVKSAEKMGRRKLAYQVQKFNEGSYILLTVASGGSLIAELERRLRVTEQVIKYITVRTDEEDKRVAKIKAIRGTRKKVSAEPVAAAPVAPTAAPVAAPAEAPEAAVAVEEPAAATAAV